MRYFLDCEFTKFDDGELISMALVREDGPSRYWIVDNITTNVSQWIKENVLDPSILLLDPVLEVENKIVSKAELPLEIYDFLKGDVQPHIISDWPEDIKYFCESVMTGNGRMVALNQLIFQVLRVKSYPTTLPNAIQHNAWWDAMALRHALI